MASDRQIDGASGGVLLLGGSGRYGGEVARLLAGAPEITRLIIAGRDVVAARDLAGTLGPKASAAHLDLSHTGELSSVAADVELVVNAAGPERLVVLPALHGAIAAGAHYCDLCADAHVTAEALRLDDEAKRAGVIALLGAGVFPGLSNLTMLRAAQALDAPRAVRHCVVRIPANGDEAPAERLRRWRTLRRVDASWQLIMRSFAAPVQIIRDGRLTEVDPAAEAVTVQLPSGLQITAYPVGFSEPLTLHATLPTLAAACALWSFVPAALNERALSLGAAVGRGELDESQAAVRFFEHLASQSPVSLQGREGLTAPWLFWAEAGGRKGDRMALARCAARGDWATTEALLCAAALRHPARTDH